MFLKIAAHPRRDVERVAEALAAGIELAPGTGQFGDQFRFAVFAFSHSWSFLNSSSVAAKTGRCTRERTTTRSAIPTIAWSPAATSVTQIHAVPPPNAVAMANTTARQKKK